MRKREKVIIFSRVPEGRRRRRVRRRAIKVVWVVAVEGFNGIVDEGVEFGVEFELLDAIVEREELHQTIGVNVFVVVDDEADF